jgi:DNA-binding transcriptional ArsR family regulator
VLAELVIGGDAHLCDWSWRRCYGRLRGQKHLVLAVAVVTPGAQLHLAVGAGAIRLLERARRDPSVGRDHLPESRRLDKSQRALVFSISVNYLLGKVRDGFMPLMIDEDRLSETFAALASSTRRTILARLAEGEANVNELAGPFDLTLTAISKHIKVLERAGLVIRSQRAQYRPCTLDPVPLEEISVWAEQYRPFWEARFDRMDDYLTRLRSQRRTGGHDD